MYADRDNADLLTLVIAMLEGESHAHRILGDMLEETGDRAKASWARSKKGKRARKLECAMGVLPCLLTLELTCDFVLKRLTGRQEPIELLRNSVRAVDRGQSEHLDLGDFKNAFAAQDALLQALLAADQSMRDPARAHHFADECRLSCRRSVRNHLADPAELTWRITHTIEVLQSRLLNA
jgi:hypothetical protein